MGGLGQGNDLVDDARERTTHTSSLAPCSPVLAKATPPTNMVTGSDMSSKHLSRRPDITYIGIIRRIPSRTPPLLILLFTRHPPDGTKHVRVIPRSLRRSHNNQETERYRTADLIPKWRFIQLEKNKASKCWVQDRLWSPCFVSPVDDILQRPATTWSAFDTFVVSATALRCTIPSARRACDRPICVRVQRRRCVALGTYRPRGPKFAHDGMHRCKRDACHRMFAPFEHTAHM